MAKGKFGADKYKPHQLGPEPASLDATPPVAAEASEPAVDKASKGVPAPRVVTDDTAALRDIKVQFSSRISYSADQQLKALAKQGHTQTDLLAEALNLLFKKHGLDEHA